MVLGTRQCVRDGVEGALDVLGVKSGLLVRLEVEGEGGKEVGEVSEWYVARTRCMAHPAES